MNFDYYKSKIIVTQSLWAKILSDGPVSGRRNCLAILFLFLGLTVFNVGFADEEDDRRIDISLSIFPRIVAVDNNFRTKLNSEKKAELVFLYREGKEQAESQVESLISENKLIGGMSFSASAVSMDQLMESGADFNPTALFISEKLDKRDVKKAIAFAVKRNRLIFSPFLGDVENGVIVGLSVTNRVKPYFNISALKRSGVVINALLMKMSKRYE